MKQKIKLLKIEPKLEDEYIGISMKEVSTYVDYVGDSRDFLEFVYDEIGCELIDVATFGNYASENHFTCIVDDEGLLKSGNVAIEYSLPINDIKHTLELCGTILVGKVGMVEGVDSYIEIGLTDEEVTYLKGNMQFKVLGLVN